MGPLRGSQKGNWRFPRKLVPIIDLISVINGNNKTTKKKLRDFSPQANYTDRATAACRRNLAPTFVDRGCRVVRPTDPHGR
jgi:hypothetical protein